MRIKNIENNVNKLKKEAVEKGRNKDKRGALHCLRKSKMMEKELAKLEGQSIMLEQQSSQLQSAQFDQSTFEHMKLGKQTMDEVQKKINIDEMENIKDDIQDQLDQQEEIGKFFAEAANQDKDELMDELDEMLAEEEMAGIQVGDQHIASQNPAAAVSNPAQPEPVSATEDEEKELAAMMAL